MRPTSPPSTGRADRTAPWSGSGWCVPAVEAALTATAHILVTRSGPALQPGPRRYTRSWIRDGAMMSAALLRMGTPGSRASSFAGTAPYQRADGFVPCCVDRRGRGLAGRARQSRRADRAHRGLLPIHRRRGPARGFLVVRRARRAHASRACWKSDGLLPVSVSHEGYLAQPVHSYWDDFWALRGVTRCGRPGANAGARPTLAAAIGRRSRRVSRARLFASIESTRARRSLDFIPGSVEWADFDPTATANALYLFDVPEGLDRPALERTFDKYLADWRAKRSGEVPSPNYTPYEIRIIGALVRLGRREAALELLRFFLAGPPPAALESMAGDCMARPQGAGARGRSAAHLDCSRIRARRCGACSPTSSSRSNPWCLPRGLAPEWIEGAGIDVQSMPTLYGALSYSLRRLDARTLRFDIAGPVDAALILRPPLGAALQSVTVNGVPLASFESDSIALTQTPAEVICVST